MIDSQLLHLFVGLKLHNEKHFQANGGQILFDLPRMERLLSGFP